ncbi:MAG: holo-ACP synthase [marine benthic group bacterium]|nr:holo-ACP synthase [Gemmatimonadota bacterium]
MLIGIGVDQVEVARIERLLANRPVRGPQKLFTERERAICDARQRRADCYAARFAAKEAFVKALGCGLREGMQWTEIEVRTEANGRPRIVLAGAAQRAFLSRGGGAIHLSFTHEDGQAVAFVVIETAD